MGAISSPLFVSFRWPSFFSIIFFLSERCCSSSATNVITSSTPIRDRDGESLVSAQGAFELGFFTPGLPGPNRYLGIWFRKSSDKINVVWVANPNNPLTDSSGILKISEESGLVLLDGEGNEVWSVPIESPHLTAKLQDDGNFVVIDDRMSSNMRMVLWQTFVHPSNTLLPGLELKRGKKLRAWKNMSNPAGGDFWLELDPQGSDQLFLRQGSNIYWRSGLWDQKGRTFSNATEVNPDEFFFYFTLNTSKLAYRSFYEHTRLALKFTGQLQFFIWYEVGGRWILVWSVPAKYCDIPAGCGPNGVCMNGPDPPCRCLRGFRPASTVDWGQGDYRRGCIRETRLTCSNDVFMPMSIWALPMNGTSVSNVTEAGCGSECFDSCKCTAYSFDAANSTCRVWSEDLVGLNDYYDDPLTTYQPSRSNLYMRLAHAGGNQRRCPDCGNTSIPFPLSTAFDCGNPRLYSNIHCKNGSEITFTTINGRTSYNVTSVHAASRTLVIETKRVLTCPRNIISEKVQRKIVKPDLHVNSPYYITNTTNIFMLNCPSSVLPPAFWACNSSSPCQTYVEDIDCFSSKMCCSSREGGHEFWHSYNSKLAEMLPCDYIATFTSKDFTSSRFLWKSGVEIGWGKADEEPLCGEQEDCQYWPNSTCSNTKTEDDKRCICDVNFRWDVSKQSCVQDGHSKASSEKSMHQNRRLGLIIAVNLVLSLCVVAAVVLCFMRRMALRKRSSRESVFIPLLRGDEGEDIDLPMLQFEVIVTSTENFSISNKLGQGGFGPVYKGQLPGGQEVAVKRLSQRSGQGVDEFKNELVLIAKLQHRNLVRLLGYCVEGDERILIYEYMPNRSLDFFLFDSDRSKHLGWKTRFNIILGITRGLLYLHQDSRLRIIHRDLKTSNILLDDEMNPKISDFGLARIFGGQEVEANTNRVVGTFGYMSPEYASHGSFSIKSDVFSFGVILLEVITGQRNACFYHLEQQCSLLGHAWELWKQNKGLQLVDQDIMEWNDEEEVLKCIQLGLLCVQEDPHDRPTMASVLGMLVNENASFTMPKKPAFFIPAQTYSGSQSSSAVLLSSSTDPRNISINKGTTSTELDGR